MIDFSQDFASQLEALRAAGWLGWAFGLVSLAAVGLLVVALGRTRFAMSLNTEAFLVQIRKLVEAGNVQRAVKLSQAHDGPVARLTRLGLNAMPHARDEMQRHMLELLAFATRGFEAARVAGAASVLLGGVLLSGAANRTVLVAGFVAVAILLLLQTYLIEARHRRDLLRVIDEVGGMKPQAP